LFPQPAKSWSFEKRRAVEDRSSHSLGGKASNRGKTIERA
jgi:hypothetical protein